MDIDKLILELIETKFQKSLFLREQKYEAAARLKDTEKQLEDKICKQISDDKNPSIRDRQEIIDNYFREKYDFDYPNYLPNPEDAKALIRELKFKIMGI